MSVEVQYGLIAHFFNLKWDEIDMFPISHYQILLEQAINISALYSGGKFEIETSKNKEDTLRDEIEDSKKFYEATRGK